MADLEYRPNWASHVVGRYPARSYDEDGEADPQLVKMECEKCGATYQVKCTSGNTRIHVLHFAKVHYHGDALRGPEKKEDT